MAIPKLVIGDLSTPLPIVQGGMGIGVSLAGLASAVANAGGIGVIASAGIGWAEPDFKVNPKRANENALRKQIRKARSLTDGVIGVNIMVAMTDFPDLVKAAAEEGVDIIFSGAGLPLAMPAYAGGGSSPKLAPIVSSGRAASVLCRKWLGKHDRLPDALVVEGPMAGGHLGFKPEQINDENFRLERLIPDVLEAVAPFEKEAGRPIPVIAAGGVYTGDDIYKYLAMGAAGVQMGTRFVATHECDAALEFKMAYIRAREEDLSIIKSPVGLPGRALRNRFIEDMESGGKSPFVCPYHCIHSCDISKSPYCITLALLNARRGSVDRGLIFAGKNAYRVEEIVAVAELMQTLVAEYERREAAEAAETQAETNAG